MTGISSKFSRGGGEGIMVGIIEKQLDKYSEEFFRHADEMMKIPLIKGLKITIEFENGENLTCSRSKDANVLKQEVKDE